MKRFIAAFIVLTSAASGQIQDDAKLYSDALKSTVWICAIDKNWGESFGTGVIVADGYILTANHVVEDRALVWAHAPERAEDGEVIGGRDWYRAKDADAMKCVVEATDPTKDLALLKVVKGEKRGSPIRLARRDPSPGQHVFTIGNGDGSLFHYAGGNVRQVRIAATNKWTEMFVARVISMTVALNPGDFGGPVLNRYGALVGMNSHSEGWTNEVTNGVHVSEIREFLKDKLN